MFVLNFYMINALGMFDKKIKKCESFIYGSNNIYNPLILSFCWEGGKSFSFENFNKKKYLLHNININKIIFTSILMLIKYYNLFKDFYIFRSVEK